MTDLRRVVNSEDASKRDAASVRTLDLTACFRYSDVTKRTPKRYEFYVLMSNGFVFAAQ